MDLHHNLIQLPVGKKTEDIVAERHDLVLLFDVTKSNPNGDPDMGNMPRRQPDTLRGLVTDVCLKRKVRNLFSLYTPDGIPLDGPGTRGYEIFIKENAILERLMKSPAIEEDAKKLFVEKYKQDLKAWTGKGAKGKGKGKKKQDVPDDQETPPETPAIDVTADVDEGKPSEANEFKQQAYRDALCQKYFDLRAFGGVTSTEGPLKGSFYGQIRGPIQFAFAESLDKTLQLDATITRCAAASEKDLKKNLQQAEGSEDEGGNRTMGRKHIVDYGIYRTHIYFSPAFATRTGFTYYDLDNFLFALTKLFNDDRSAARPELRVVALIDFQHKGALGDEYSHKLFKMVDVRMKREDGKPVKEFPHSLDDYEGEAPIDGQVVKENVANGAKQVLVTAKRLVWEIPECKKVTSIAAH